MWDLCLDDAYLGSFTRKPDAVAHGRKLCYELRADVTVALLVERKDGSVAATHRY